MNASDVFRTGLQDGIGEHIATDDLDQTFRRVYKDVPRPILKRPPRNKLDDSFFREVAFAYRKAVEAGLPPGETIANDSGIRAARSTVGSPKRASAVSCRPRNKGR